MNLLKGTDIAETLDRIPCEAVIGGERADGTRETVKFDALIRIPASVKEMLEKRARLSDARDNYNDHDLVDEYLVRWENMPGPDGQDVPFSEEAKREAMSHIGYYRALVRACARALYDARE